MELIIEGILTHTFHLTNVIYEKSVFFCHIWHQWNRCTLQNLFWKTYSINRKLIWLRSRVYLSVMLQLKSCIFQSVQLVSTILLKKKWKKRKMNQGQTNFASEKTENQTLLQKDFKKLILTYWKKNAFYWI